MQGKSAQNVEITFPDAIESAYETNGIEEKIGEVTIQNNKLCFDMASYRPKTFAVRLKKGNVKAAPIKIFHFSYRLIAKLSLLKTLVILFLSIKKEIVSLLN